MAFEAIDRLKADFTDQYVIVTDNRPELARFVGFVGQVKTVNMSGRALVEFTGYLNNPAWHDIDVAALKVVDKPPDPEPPAKKKASKPASKGPSAKRASAADVLAAVRGGKAAKQAPKDAAGRAAKKTSPSVGKSTADILAAARGGGGASAPVPTDRPAAKKKSPSLGLSTDDVLAAARGKKPAPTEAPRPTSKKEPSPQQKPSGMTTEEILAAARAAKAPAEDAPKPDALDLLEAGGKQPAEPRRKLTAKDIRDIGAGKLSIRREQPIATQPLPQKKLKPVDAEEVVPDALPEKPDQSKLTAADILKLGARK